VGKVDAGSALVGQAGQTMEEIVGSIKRVTDIMGEIAAASVEQTSGIEQINQAITQMDHVTQQNAALVEQAAAAAQSLQEQAGGLVEVVSVFKVADNEALASAAVAPAPRTATVTTLKRRKPARVRQQVETEPMTWTRKVANAKAGEAEWRGVLAATERSISEE
jgi:methyl-accepting chemotaxis protein